MWYRLLQKLEAELRAATGKDVKIGAYPPITANISTDGSVFLIRGEETNQDPTTQERVRVTFYLETWVNEGDPDYAVGSEKLVTLETQIEDALIAYRNRVGSLDQSACMLDERWQVLDVYVDKKAGDLDSRRPILGTQYTLVAQLFDTSDVEGIW